MKKLNTPTGIVLWPNSSPLAQMMNASFYETFPFEVDSGRVPVQVKAATGVEIKNGVVRSFADPAVNCAVWRDPFEEQDLVLLADKSSTATYSQCLDLLNQVLPAETNNVVAFASQPTRELEAGFRVSVAASLERDLEGLDPRIDRFRGQRISGPSGVLLGVAADLGQSAFCVVVEHASDSQYVSSSAIKAAMLAFTRLTRIESYRGQMSDQAIRMHKHLKQWAEDETQRYENKHFGTLLDDNESSFYESAKRAQQEIRLNEDIEWIEKLFAGIQDGKDELDHSRIVFLKSELDRLGLYKEFEKRFVALEP